jgi:hypothetical protein
VRDAAEGITVRAIDNLLASNLHYTDRPRGGLHAE